MNLYLRPSKVTTKFFGGLLKARDLVQRRFSTESPSRVRVSDITSIQTREGGLYRGAVPASFFSMLKSEVVHRTRFRTKADTRRRIYEDIKVYPSRQRRHSTFDQQTLLERHHAAIHGSRGPGQARGSFSAVLAPG